MEEKDFKKSIFSVIVQPCIYSLIFVCVQSSLVWGVSGSGVVSRLEGLQP